MNQHTSKLRIQHLVLVLSMGIFMNVLSVQKPNVVLILIDDLSHYGVSAYGATMVSSNNGYFKNVSVSTPCIDRLAQEGLMCNNAFAYPLCENTRIALMSGQTNNRNYLRCKSQHASDITFGDTFKKAGYATGITGKWKQTRGTKEIAGEKYIYEFGWDEFCCFDVVGEEQRFINPNLVINGVITNYQGREDLDPETGRRWYGPDICNRFALNFIEKHKAEPFFLYYPMLLVHDEHKPTPDTKPDSIFDHFDESKFNNREHHGDDQLYFPDMVRYMDKLIGKVADKLDELGLRENTLLIVMGDNGTKEAFSHVFPNGAVYPGRKGGNADNGIHVPLILSQPGKVPVDKTGSIRKYDGLVNLTDIYPTIAEASGVKIPNHTQLDGISFWPQALGKKGEPRKVIYTWYNANYLYTSTNTIIEYAFDKNFKLYSPSEKFPEGRFFDLRTDRLEQAGSHYETLPFKVLLYNGLNLDSLTQEQKLAYNKLRKVLEDNKMTPVSTLSIKKAPKMMKIGEVCKLVCEVLPTNATRTNVIWESDAPEIVSIDKFGVLHAHKSGAVKISVYSWDDAFPQAANEQVTFISTGIRDQVEIVVN